MKTQRSHHVYVVELDKGVLKEKRFLTENPNHDHRKACLYVGMTGLTPEERFQNHRDGYKANRYVMKYGLRLRRRMYEKYNPMSYAEAKNLEIELATKLRAKGYAVWQK